MTEPERQQKSKRSSLEWLDAVLTDEADFECQFHVESVDPTDSTLSRRISRLKRMQTRTCELLD